MSIEATQVTRFFGSAPAVQRLSLSAPSGAITGLVGPNGAGKTTLLLMLAALLRPDTGTIKVAGLDPVTQPRQVHQAVGWMPDAFGTWDSLTCTEILLTFAAAQGLDDVTARERTADMLTLVHLDDMARTPARVLSRGQKQRLGLARALVHAPRVLLLDEPAAGMDPRSRADLRGILRDLAGQGATVLVSSHVLGELEEMVDGVVFMSRGRAVVPPGAGPADEAAAALGQDAEEPGAESGAGTAAAGGVVPVRPTPLRTSWRMRALNPERLAAWARAGTPPGAVLDPDGSVHLEVPDDAAAARILRQAVEDGVEVVSFAPVTGALEAAYLAMEEERA
ncbi:ABC transporter ATP-binding protein [Actinomyces ruminis]|uniref:ABC transporter ATP-binding protein n=1 Tax=Actinomyces ruminis TaxID=1937003 RepID=A0ABX4MDB2_9ACTO|nr:ABC transporter ATP-binding protein [Actinomyces ruminis]PHP53326.1 ABC transporter ATP-binding protein [Actinomyces ruminis]